MKLTLNLEPDKISIIKALAKSPNQSVSQQIEIILGKPNLPKTPFSTRAAGIIKRNKFNNLDKLRNEYLKEDYG